MTAPPALRPSGQFTSLLSRNRICAAKSNDLAAAAASRRTIDICMTRHFYLAAAFMVLAASTTSALAGPPAYLVLRRPESAGKHHRPGQQDAVMYDVRSGGYAYGFFGVAPRSHASRHFGVNRTYTQWSTW
jgi:hypothetical protein